MLGFSGFYPKFVKKYINLNRIIEKAVKKYTRDVKLRKFPIKKIFYMEQSADNTELKDKINSSIKNNKGKIFTFIVLLILIAAFVFIMKEINKKKMILFLKNIYKLVLI